MTNRNPILGPRAAVLVDALLDELERTCPKRPGLRTRRSWLWRLLPGPWRRAHITVGWVLWVADAWRMVAPAPAVRVLAHEGVHWLQRARWGRWGFAWRYAVPWLRADLEAEAYALEARAVDAMHPGTMTNALADAAEALGSWTYLLGPSSRHAERLAAHYARPAADLLPWLALVERAARAAAPEVLP
jgi:hypothetical protein